MSDNKARPVSPAAEEQTEDFLKRRRVVKGLTSIPVILTLGTVAERAHASIFQCIGQVQPGEEIDCQLTGPNTPPNEINQPPGADKWPWDGYDTNEDGTIDSWCVSYAEEDGTLVRHIDQNGDEIGGLAAPDAANPVTVSCLCSFA